MRLDAHPHLEGVLLIASDVHPDERGSFRRIVDLSTLAGLGFAAPSAQISAAKNSWRGTVRGLHYQVAPDQETKILWCSAGRCYDVLVDLRPSSRSYGRWSGLELSAGDALAVFIPPGIAHGYQTLEDDTELVYVIDTPFAAESARSLLWNDAQLKIDWPLEMTEISLTRPRSPPVAARVVMTGSSGLLGRAIALHWNLPDFELVAMTHESADLLAPGVPSRIVEQLRPDVLIHLAWCASGRMGYRSDPDNDRWVSASTELAETCRSHGVRFLGTGTTVDDSPEPQDAYTAAKARLRQALSGGIANRTVTWLRPFYVFSPSDGRPALVAEAIAARDEGHVLRLRTPEQAHDFILVEDVAHAVIEIVRHDLRGSIDIGSGTLRRVRTLAAALGAQWEPNGVPAESAPQSNEAADIAALLEIGWEPRLTERIFAA